MSQINTTLFALTGNIDGLVAASEGASKLLEGLTNQALTAKKIVNIIGTETDSQGTKFLDRTLRKVELAVDKYKSLMLDLRTSPNGSTLLEATEVVDFGKQQRDEEQFRNWQFRTMQRLGKLGIQLEEDKQKAVKSATDATLKGATEVKVAEEKSANKKIQVYTKLFDEIEKKEKKALAENRFAEAERLKNVKATLKGQTEQLEKQDKDRQEYTNRWTKLLNQQDSERNKANNEALAREKRNATEQDKINKRAAAEKKRLNNEINADNEKFVREEEKRNRQLYQMNMRLAKSRAAMRNSLAGEELANKVQGSAQSGSSMLSKFFGGEKTFTPQGLANIESARASLQGIAETGKITKTRLNDLFTAFNKGTVSTLGPLNSLERRTLKSMYNLRQAVKTADEAGTRTNELLLTPRGAARILAVQQFHRAISAVTNALAQAEEQAKKFDIKIAEIQTITQRSSQTTQEWSKALLELSGRFGFDILDTANAAYEAVSNQIAEGVEVTHFLADAFNFARATASTAEQSVNLLSTVLNAYNLNASEATKVSATLFKLIDLGRVRAGDIANTFGNTAILAAQLNISLEELSAGMATLTIQGVQHNTAMTLMNNIILKLLKPSTAMKELLNDWGVASGEAAINTFGFEGVLKRLDKELQTGGLSRIADLEKDLRAIRAAAGLTGNAFDKFSEALREIKTSQADYDKAVEITSRNMGARLEQEEAKIQAVMLEISTSIQKAKLSFYEAFGGADEALRPLLETYENLTVLMYKLFEGLGYLQKGLDGVSDSIIGSATAATTLAASMSFFASPMLSASIGLIVFAINEAASAMSRLERETDKYRKTLNMAGEESVRISNKILTAQNAAFREPIEAAQQRLLRFQAGLNQALNAAVKIPTELQQKLSSIKLDISLIDANELESAKIKIQEINRLITLKDAFIKIKDFDGAKKTFQDILGIAVDVNKQITSAVKGIESEIENLKGEQADKTVESKLMGKSDKAQIGILSQEAVKLITEAENEQDLDKANTKLEKAKQYYEQIISLTANKKNTGAYFTSINEIIDKQIALQEKFKVDLEANLQDPEKMIEQMGEPLEDQLKLVTQQEQVWAKINETLTGINGQLDRLTEKQQALNQSQITTNVEAGVQLSALQKRITDRRMIVGSEIGNRVDDTNYEALFKSLKEIGDVGKFLENAPKEDILGLKDLIKRTIPDLEKAAPGNVKVNEALTFAKSAEQLLSNVLTSRGNTESGQKNIDILKNQQAAILKSFADSQVPLENALKKYPEIYKSVLDDIEKSMEKTTFNLQEKVKLLDDLLKESAEITLNRGQGGQGGLGFAMGGLNPGRDSNTIKASAGEFMVNSQASARNYSALSAMNAGFNSSGTGSTINVDTVNMNMTNSVNASPKQLVDEFRRELRRGTGRLT